MRLFTTDFSTTDDSRLTTNPRVETVSEITDPPATELPATPSTTEAPGVLLYPEAFETIVAMLRDGITRLAADDPAPFLRLTIPPVISRRTIERAGYVASFPPARHCAQLCGRREALGQAVGAAGSRGR